MTESVTMDAQVREYAAGVAVHLADLPPEVRADLVADLEQHLVEVAADSDVPLTVSLGSPATYAMELRASAGLDRLGEDDGASSVVAAVRRAVAGVRARPRVAAAWSVASEMRPAWWVARGLAPVALVASLSYDTSRGIGWFLAGVVGVVVSVDIGRRRPERFDVRAAIGAANVLAAGALLLVTAEFVQYGFPVHHQTVVEEVLPRHLVHPGGEPITNIYAFDADGRPVRGLFLYDGAGRPIEVRRGAGEMFDIQTDYQRAQDGTPLRNFFPLQQYVEETDDGGTQRLRPRPEPQVDVPALARTAGIAPPEDPQPGATQPPAANDSGSPRAPTRSTKEDR